MSAQLDALKKIATALDARIGLILQLEDLEKELLDAVENFAAVAESVEFVRSCPIRVGGHETVSQADIDAAIERGLKRQLRTMPYAEYLKTPHWQECRKNALKAADYRCQICNASNVVLHVHHRTYERRGHELPSDLTTLCEACHAKFHDKLPQDAGE